MDFIIERLKFHYNGGEEAKYFIEVVQPTAKRKRRTHKKITGEQQESLREGLLLIIGIHHKDPTD